MIDGLMKPYVASIVRLMIGARFTRSPLARARPKTLVSYHGLATPFSSTKLPVFRSRSNFTNSVS
ncbi:hypothetical protein D9M71_759270 [compost metagenome]